MQCARISLCGHRNLPETPDNANNINIATYETNSDRCVRRCRLLPAKKPKRKDNLILDFMIISDCLELIDPKAES